MAKTKTEENLLNAFAGESQARNKYNFFAGVARKEGLEQIAAIFDETAGNEHEHAKRFYLNPFCGMCVRGIAISFSGGL